MRCTGSLGSGFQHLGCGQHEFEIPVKTQANSIVSMSGHKII